jgi:hypothetical protein
MTPNQETLQSVRDHLRTRNLLHVVKGIPGIESLNIMVHKRGPIKYIKINFGTIRSVGGRAEYRGVYVNQNGKTSQRLLTNGFGEAQPSEKSLGLVTKPPEIYAEPWSWLPRPAEVLSEQDMALVRLYHLLWAEKESYEGQKLTSPDIDSLCQVLQALANTERYQAENPVVVPETVDKEGDSVMSEEPEDQDSAVTDQDGDSLMSDPPEAPVAPSKRKNPVGGSSPTFNQGLAGLQQAVGEELLSRLPSHEEVTYTRVFSHGSARHVAVKIGNYETDTKSYNGVWGFMMHMNNNVNSAPEIYFKRQREENKRQMYLMDWEDLQADDFIFEKAFQELATMAELKAVTKYYFLLAESNAIRGFGNSGIPVNRTFVMHMKTVCSRLEEKADTIPSDRSFIASTTTATNTSASGDSEFGGAEMAEKGPEEPEDLERELDGILDWNIAYPEWESSVSAISEGSVVSKESVESVASDETVKPQRKLPGPKRTNRPIVIDDEDEDDDGDEMEDDDGD